MGQFDNYPVLKLAEILYTASAKKFIFYDKSTKIF